MAGNQQEWQKYKKIMANKRTGRKEEKKNLGQANCIMVQKMNPTVTGKLKTMRTNRNKRICRFYKFFITDAKKC